MVMDKTHRQENATRHSSNAHAATADKEWSLGQNKSGERFGRQTTIVLSEGTLEVGQNTVIARDKVFPVERHCLMVRVIFFFQVDEVIEMSRAVKFVGVNLYSSQYTHFVVTRSCRSHITS